MRQAPSFTLATHWASGLLLLPVDEELAVIKTFSFGGSSRHWTKQWEVKVHARSQTRLSHCMNHFGRLASLRRVTTQASAPSHTMHRMPVCLPLGFDPDAAFVHQVNLLLNNLLTVFSMLHGFTIQVQVLWIDGLFIKHLVEFGA
jgi:hypothetical protein